MLFTASSLYAACGDLHAGALAVFGPDFRLCLLISQPLAFAVFSETRAGRHAMPPRLIKKG